MCGVFQHPVSEGVLRAGIGNDFVARSGSFEFTIKVVDLILCHVRIGTTGQHEHVCLYRAGLRGRSGIEHAVNTHHAPQILSCARHLQHDTSTEAVTDCTDACWIDIRLCAKKIACRIKARPHQRQVGPYFRRKHEGLSWTVRLLVLPIHVESNRNISRFREPSGAVTRVLIET